MSMLILVVMFMMLMTMVMSLTFIFSPRFFLFLTVRLSIQLSSHSQQFLERHFNSFWHFLLFFWPPLNFHTKMKIWVWRLTFGSNMMQYRKKCRLIENTMAAFFWMLHGKTHGVEGHGKTHGCYVSLYPWVLPWNYGKTHYMAKPIYHEFCHGIWVLP